MSCTHPMTTEEIRLCIDPGCDPADHPHTAVVCAICGDEIEEEKP